MSLKDEHLMRTDTFIYGSVTKHGAERSKHLASILAARTQDPIAPLKQVGGCRKCQARLENPHADYHLTAVIDLEGKI